MYGPCCTCRCHSKAYKRPPLCSDPVAVVFACEKCRNEHWVQFPYEPVRPVKTPSSYRDSYDEDGEGLEAL